MGVIATLGVLGFGILGLVLTISDVLKSGASTVCTVIKQNVVRKECGICGPCYQYQGCQQCYIVDYTCDVTFKYLGNYTAVKSDICGDSPDVSWCIAEYPDGYKTTCWYSPANPNSMTFMNPNYSWIAFSASIILILLSIGLGFFVWRTRKFENHTFFG